MWVTIFKLVQFITMGVFVVFISDFRKKKGMVPLVNEKITKTLKFTYFGPVIICAYTLTTIDYLTAFDFVALALTILGTIVVVKSKLDLGICHTWAGYCKPETMGSWHVFANIPENDSISISFSNTTTFMVTDTFLNQYLLYIIGGGGGVGGVGAVMFIRKRREDYD